MKYKCASCLHEFEGGTFTTQCEKCKSTEIYEASESDSESNSDSVSVSNSVSIIEGFNCETLVLRYFSF